MKEKKIPNLFNKVKLEYVIKKLFQILRSLTIILYIAMNLAIIYMVCSHTKYPSITNWNVLRGVMLTVLFTAIIPGIFITILFIQIENTIFKIFKGLSQLILLVSLPYIGIIFGLMISMAIPSHTTNPDNYRKADTYINDLLEKPEFVMLPDTLPNQITDVDYLYDYISCFDDNYLTLEISWTYNEEMDYQKAKSEMQSYEATNNQVLDDGFQMFYAIGNKQDDKQRFCFGYDDKTNRVTYRIYYEWVS